ncbi:diaminopimelate decarboxylase [Peptostreptococcus equinus]|uniref:Diaminopimelate decarboxylase n=1 Tax=Peptostreptococcus equinus TaxID=3003601 RepID=A0ABY7JP85_9FIRM|nr:diaminopimelate decarboxylase [Peptostreptococcus sp. CBA3647]WAW14706.1 diaminopimelate decarboxylase [Peptostreptococcus sp. CBA3647]
MKLHGNSIINESSHLEIGGMDCVDLTTVYSTPIFVYDENLIRQQCRRFHKVLSESGLDYHISYASKAFLCKEIVRIMQEENMGLDVVSQGEMFNALSVEFDSKSIHFHGNNKTPSEIDYAIKNNIGCFVIDSIDEIYKVEKACARAEKSVNCLLRLTPGVEAHTHEFITTGNEDSKFGMNIDNGEALKAFKILIESEYLNLKGFHFHIGSQIFGTDGTKAAINKVFDWMSSIETNYPFKTEVLNIGGGFGIRYTAEDISYPIEDALNDIILHLKESSVFYSIDMPQLWLEPGRSIVGEAGTTLYTIGTIKEIPGIRTYVSVDGGMTDNIRTSLYGAKYEVAIANKMNDKATELVTIAGKCCESGDILARDVKIPKAEVGDILAMSCTGAYHYSMASNYNHMPKPSVIFVKDGQSKVAIKRESYEDMIKNQV